MAWGSRPPTKIEQGFFSGFPRMQNGMFVILCNTSGLCGTRCNESQLAAEVISHTVVASLNAVASEGKEHCCAFIVL